MPARGAVPAVSHGEVEAFAEQVLAVLAEQDRPVRCQEVVSALGQDASVARHVERVRHRLKKLRAAGRVEELARGMFTLPRARGPANG